MARSKVGERETAQGSVEVPVVQHRLSADGADPLLLAGVNDAPEDARRLVERLRGIPSRVNLLPYNESPGLPFRRSSEERMQAFRKVLHRAGIRTLVRESRGADIAAACGQLAARGRAPAAAREVR